MSIETDLSAYRLADDAIGLFLEYRDVHGYDEESARLAAATETAQGIEAEQELRAHGELPPAVAFEVDSAESARLNGMVYP